MSVWQASIHLDVRGHVGPLVKESPSPSRGYFLLAFLRTRRVYPQSSVFTVYWPRKAFSRSRRDGVGRLEPVGQVQLVVQDPTALRRSSNSTHDMLADSSAATNICERRASSVRPGISPPANADRLRGTRRRTAGCAAASRFRRCARVWARLRAAVSPCARESARARARQLHAHPAELAAVARRDS